MKIIVANPKDEEHIKLFKEYNDKLDLNYINKLKAQEIKKILFNTKEDKLNNISYIYGYNDLKRCHIYFENYDFKNLSFLNQVTEYAKEALEMDSISFHIPNDNRIISKLESVGFQLLGALNDSNNLIMEQIDSEEKEITQKRR